MKLIKVELQYEIQADGSSKTILTIDGQQESLSSSLGKGSREVSDFSQNFFPELVTYLNVGVNTSRITVFFDGDEESYRIFQNAYLQYYQENPELSISLVNKRDIDIPRIPQPTQEIESLFSNYSDDIKNKIEQYVREIESEIEGEVDLWGKQYENHKSKIIAEVDDKKEKIVNRIDEIKQATVIDKQYFFDSEKDFRFYSFSACTAYYYGEKVRNYCKERANELQEQIKSLDSVFDIDHKLPEAFNIFLENLGLKDTSKTSTSYYRVEHHIEKEEVTQIVQTYNNFLETYLDTVQADLLNQLQEVSCNELKEMEKTKFFSDKFLYAQMDKTKEFLQEIDDSIPVLKKQIVETFNEPRK